MKLLTKALCLTTCLTSFSIAHAANDDLAISKKSRRLQAVQAKPLKGKKLKTRKKLSKSSSRKLGSATDQQGMSTVQKYFKATVRSGYTSNPNFYITKNLQDPTSVDGGNNLTTNLRPLLNLGNMSAELMQFMGYAGYPNPLPTITAGTNDLAGLDNRISVLEGSSSSVQNLTFGHATSISGLSGRVSVLENAGYRTAGQVNDAITSFGYQTQSNVNSAIATAIAPLATSSSVTAIDGRVTIIETDYQNASDVSSAITAAISPIDGRVTAVEVAVPNPTIATRLAMIGDTTTGQGGALQTLAGNATNLNGLITGGVVADDGNDLHALAVAEAANPGVLADVAANMQPGDAAVVRGLVNGVEGIFDSLKKLGIQSIDQRTRILTHDQSTTLSNKISAAYSDGDNITSENIDDWRNLLANTVSAGQVISKECEQVIYNQVHYYTNSTIGDVTLAEAFNKILGIQTLSTTSTLSNSNKNSLEKILKKGRCISTANIEHVRTILKHAITESIHLSSDIASHLTLYYAKENLITKGVVANDGAVIRALIDGNNPNGVRVDGMRIRGTGMKILDSINTILNINLWDQELVSGPYLTNDQTRFLHKIFENAGLDPLIVSNETFQEFGDLIASTFVAGNTITVDQETILQDVVSTYTINNTGTLADDFNIFLGESNVGEGNVLSNPQQATLNTAFSTGSDITSDNLLAMRTIVAAGVSDGTALTASQVSVLQAFYPIPTALTTDEALSLNALGGLSNAQMQNLINFVTALTTASSGAGLAPGSTVVWQTTTATAVGGGVFTYVFS